MEGKRMLDIKKGMQFPVLGAAYYPEDWDEAEQDRDIASMQKAGLGCVRIGEFSWHKMEPSDGAFDFAWLHRVVDKLEAAGIGVILGTPSATPPIWLEEKDPTMMVQNGDGLREIHGGRRHACSNNETYRFYAARIAEKLAREFGTHTNLVGWQIDNELYIQGGGCFCENCRRGYHVHLEEKYKTINELNHRWNLNLFSQWYDRFDQVSMPQRSWQNPHLFFEWRTFQANSQIAFARMQADLIRKYSKAPIGTNLMPVFGIDYEKIAEFTDVMQYDHYHDETEQWQAAMWFDYMRTLKERPFWNSETSVSWGGNTETPKNLRPAGFCRVNSWLPVALGGEANFYWLWRQHWAGHELMHGSVLYASGRPTQAFGEVQEVSQGFAKSRDFLTNTKVKTDVAMMLSAHNANLMAFQRLVYEDVQYAAEENAAYDLRTIRFYKHIVEYGIRPDVIGVNKALDAYKLLFTPFMLTLELGDLTQRIREWVEQGGTWVVGPMTDLRNDIGAHYVDRETGMLEEFTGATLAYQVPDAEHRIGCQWADGDAFMANLWLQLFDAPAGAEVLVKTTGDYFPALGDKALVFEKKIGRGKVIVLGTIPSEEDMHRLLDVVIRESNAQKFDVTGKLMVAKREGAGQEGYSVVNHTDIPATLRLEGIYRDLLSNELCSGRIPMAAYQVRMLKKEQS